MTNDDHRQSLRSSLDDDSDDIGEQLVVTQDGGTSTAANGKQALHKSFKTIDGLALVVGIIIGSGIFASPGDVLKYSGSVGASMISWSVAGVLVLLASLCYVELGCMIPSAAGEQAYIEAAYGRLLTFVFVWTNFFVLRTGSMAIIAIIFARYIGSVVLDLDVRNDSDIDAKPAVKILAMCAIVLLSVLNSFGAKQGARIQKFFTFLKLFAVGFIMVVGFAQNAKGTDASRENFSQSFEQLETGEPTGFGASMIPALWAYDGWNAANYIAEELTHPEKQLPKILAIGVPCVTIVYVLVNVAYFSVLPAQVILESKGIAIDFVETAFKNWGSATTGRVFGHMLAVFVGLSAFGALNGSIMTAGRFHFAAARDGHFPRLIAHLHPKTNAPVRAFIIQGVWAIILIIPGNFGVLVSYFGMTSWLFYGLVGVALLLLRRNRPDAHRPYRVHLYPLTPLLLVGLSCYLVVDSIRANPLPSIAALGFVVLSLPVYWLVFHTRALDRFGVWLSSLTGSQFFIVRRTSQHGGQEQFVELGELGDEPTTRTNDAIDVGTNN